MECCGYALLCPLDLDSNGKFVHVHTLKVGITAPLKFKRHFDTELLFSLYFKRQLYFNTRPRRHLYLELFFFALNLAPSQLGIFISGAVIPTFTVLCIRGFYILG